MPDPNWTSEYQFNQPPESNGFTRTIYNTPVVTEVTGGNPSDRRVEINSDTGDCVFITSDVPSLDANTGVTLEASVSCTGSGDAGFELTFLDYAVLIMVWEDRVSISMPRGDNGEPSVEQDIPTAANSSPVLMRFTFDNQRLVRIYRDLSEIHSFTAHPVTKPFQRVLWWGEGGGVQLFNVLRFWTGGAMPPG